MENSKNGSDILSEKLDIVASNNSSTIRSSEKINQIRRNYSDQDLQSYLLQGVSRTFALTIPELPAKLQKIIGNAYLLCRIIDTIEDSALSRSQKEFFCQQFVDVVKGSTDAYPFAEELSHMLGTETNQSEHELIWLTKRVITITYNFNMNQRQALERCVDIMAEGMVYFQENASPAGLKDVEETNKYCYCVAGVVGEMLTELFCLYSSEIAKNRERLMDLSVRFGLALQMTNILKDMWADYERSVCWLPRSVFENHGFDLQGLPEGRSTQQFQDGLGYLVGLTNAHLHKALEYTLLIPTEEPEIRRFCLWSMGMSALTLRKINKKRGFTDGEQVKISRNSVKASILLINKTVKHDRLIKLLFKIASVGLPCYK